MRAGRRDRFIEIQRATITRSAAGEVVETWARIVTGWAEVIVTSGNQVANMGEVWRDASNRRVSGKMARFVLPYLAGLTNRDRIVYEEENWNILNIKEIGRRAGIELLAELTE